MKQLIPLIFCLSLLSQMAILNSCKKDKKDAQAGAFVPTITNFPKIKTYTDSSDSYLVTLSYNSAGKLIKEVLNDGEYADILYTSNQVTVNAYDSTGILEYTGVYTLNSSGLATTLIGTDFDYKKEVHFSKFFPFLKKRNTKSSVDTINYNYDINGYMIKKIYINSGNNDTTIYNYVNGNEAFQISSFDTTSFEYFTDKINTIGFQNMGITFLGKQNINLIKTETDSYPGENYTYMFDAKSRVTKKLFWSNGHIVNSETYTYIE
jgi:hypothetical protein